MKNKFLLALLSVMLCSIKTNAQDLANDKLLNVGINVSGTNRSSVETYSNNTSSTDKLNYLQENISLVYSQIHTKNVAYGVGVTFMDNSNFNRTIPYSVSGSVDFTLAKYIKIFDRIYFVPGVTVSEGYTYTEQYLNLSDSYVKTHSYLTQVALTPFAFAYRINNKFIINATLGSDNVNYAFYIKKYPDNSTYKSKNLYYNLNLNQSFTLGFSYIIKE